MSDPTPTTLFGTGPAPAAAPGPTAGACLNCAATLPVTTPPPRYCPACGQETTIKPPTLMEFAQQFGGSVLAAEGALWRSLKLLLLKPGALTLAYLQGRRRHYVLPLRLYLTLSLLALLLMKFTANVRLDVSDAELKTETATFTVAAFGTRRAGMDKGRFYCEELPAWVCRRLERRLDVAPKAVRRELAELPQRFIGQWGTAMFLLVPLYAGLMRLLYLNRGLRYTEHLVFALHLHAFWFVALATATLPLPAATGLAMLTMPVYAYLAARRVYGGRHWATALRGLLVVVVYSLVLMLAVVAVLIAALLF